MAKENKAKDLAKSGVESASGFVKKFKEFALKGNVMDMAVGVIIGAAFQDIVSSLTENFINPILGCIGGAEVQGKIHLMGDQYLNYGAFLTAVINFIIMAFVIFLMLKTVNKIMNIGKKETPSEPETSPEPSKEELLLTEIRHLLAEQSKEKIKN